MTRKERPTLKNLSEYQRAMERFENFHDTPILPDLYVVARVDARRAGNEWDAVAPGNYPYGDTIVDTFVDTGRRMFSMGLRCIYGFIHGDEVSLLIDPTELSNARRRQKMISLLSSAAAVGFFKKSGLPVYFHGKLSELPTFDHAIDYFVWQRKVATRNLYSSLIRNILIRRGQSPTQIDEKLSPLNEADRIAYAVELGVRPEELAPRIRTGIGMWWNLKGEVPTIEICQNLPENEADYIAFLKNTLSHSGSGTDADPEDVPWKEVQISAEGRANQHRTPQKESGAPFRLNASQTRRTPFRVAGIPKKSRE